MSGRGSERILTLIEWLAEQRAPVALADVAGALAMPKSSALGLVRTLVEHGYVERNAAGSYRLIRLPGEPAGTRPAHGTLVRVLDPFVRTLVAEVQETGFIAVLDADRNVAYLIKHLPNREVRYDRDISRLRAAHQVASGHILLGGLAPADLTTYAENAAVTDGDPTLSTAIPALVERAQADGYAVNSHGRVDGAAGVAAPLVDGSDTIQAALNIAGPRERFIAQLDTAIQATVAQARLASAALARVSAPVSKPQGGKTAQTETLT